MDTNERPRLMTGNPKKLAELLRLGLDASMGEPSPDLPEVLSDPVTVAVRKSLLCGPGTVVEDTSLDVDGADVGVEVKWLMDNLSSLSGRRAVFRVILAMNDGDTVSVFEGRQEGRLDGSRPSSVGAFGFDPCFVPDGSGGRTLLELEKSGMKDLFSARARAVEAFNAREPLSRVKTSDIPEWTGEWQDGSSPRLPKP